MLSAKPQTTEDPEKMSTPSWKAFLRPSMSARMPPMMLPVIMPIKYQNVMVPMADMSRCMACMIDGTT